MRSLSWKLAGALLLVVVISVGSMAYLTNRSTTREFQQYIIQGNMMHIQGIDTSLGEYYSRKQSWNNVQEILPGLLRMSGDRLILSDSTGLIIGDTGGGVLGETTRKLGLAGYGTPIIVSGQERGSFYYLSSGVMGMMGGNMMGMMEGQPVPADVNSAEAEFLGRVNRNLWIAAFVAIAIALLAGLVLTRQITNPVRALTKGARQISRGDLDYRVDVKSKDELGKLVTSFNSMAASLSNNEQLRRRMTADIAHELRTPLTIIEGTVDGMLDGVFTPDQEHLNSIKEQTTLLTRLISDLRDLSLAESGQLKLDLANDDIVNLLKQKVEQVEAVARDKGLKLSFRTDGAVPEIKIDRMRIEQAVANLLTNAIHHTPPGGSINVSVKVGTGETNQHGVLISVADTGEGIAPEHLPHIFERFYRVSDSRARSEGGTGLGLAIVKYLVQAHGGKVWAESKPGEGSTLFVFLPGKS